MVRNSTGGSGTKGLARKHQTMSGNSVLRLPENELEQFACVTKMLGNGMVEVYTDNNIRLIGHIRNKFRGKQKRHNMLSIHTIVLIGLREWEKEPKNCDIMTMYDDNQIEQLQHIPSIKINNALRLRNENVFGSVTNSESVIFAQADSDELIDIPSKSAVANEFEVPQEEMLDIDFI